MKSKKKEKKKKTPKVAPSKPPKFEKWNMGTSAVPSLLPPIWLRMGLTKEKWEKMGEPKRLKGKKNDE